MSGGLIYPPFVEISRSRYHIGIFIPELGLIFCNIHFTGLLAEFWFADFFNHGQHHRYTGRQKHGEPELIRRHLLMIP